jgi:phosphoribosyl-ATP pyrophosphohydrolase
MPNNHISLEELFPLIKQRISNQDPDSYSYKLAKEGLEKITRKIGEEAVEVVIASFVHEKKHSEKSREELIGEVCDLFFHCLVLLASQNIEFSEVLAEAGRRNKIKK